jgi:hypothetical protein
MSTKHSSCDNFGIYNNAVVKLTTTTTTGVKHAQLQQHRMIGLRASTTVAHLHGSLLGGDGRPGRHCFMQPGQHFKRGLV